MTNIQKQENALVAQPKTAESATRELELVLSFFPRVDTSLSLVVGIEIGMLAFLASKAPPVTGPTLPVVLTLASAILIGASIRVIYLGLFPRLEGGGSSLVYFRAIARR